MSFECAHCHEYVAGVGVDPPQFCAGCPKTPTCAVCKVEFKWGSPACGHNVHGEFPTGGRAAVRTIYLADGKYEFDLRDGWDVVAARRHGVEWPAGMELRFTNCFVAALTRIVELEDAKPDTIQQAAAWLKSRFSHPSKRAVEASQLADEMLKSLQR